MSRTCGKRHNKEIKKGITGDTATDSALQRLSAVLKEIAESAVEEDKEKTPVESTNKGKRSHDNKKTRKGGDK